MLETDDKPNYNSELFPCPHKHCDETDNTYSHYTDNAKHDIFNDTHEFNHWLGVSLKLGNTLGSSSRRRNCGFMHVMEFPLEPMNVIKRALSHVATLGCYFIGYVKFRIETALC